MSLTSWLLTVRVSLQTWKCTGFTNRSVILTSLKIIEATYTVNIPGNNTLKGYVYSAELKVRLIK